MVIFNMLRTVGSFHGFDVRYLSSPCSLEIANGVLKLCDRVLLCTCVELETMITYDYGLFLVNSHADMS
jgi:hypothetical protein